MLHLTVIEVMNVSSKLAIIRAQLKPFDPEFFFRLPTHSRDAHSNFLLSLLKLKLKFLLTMPYWYARRIRVNRVMCILLYQNLTSLI